MLCSFIQLLLKDESSTNKDVSAKFQEEIIIHSPKKAVPVSQDKLVTQ